MAKPRSIPDLSAGEPFAAAAARIVAVRAEELVEHATDVLDTSDIERVHDMRVATRRLRAALEIFEACFPRKRLKGVLRDVKSLADALGERRDRDVQIVALEQFAERIAAPDRPGIASLVSRLREEQGLANEVLAAALAGDRVAGLGRRVGEMIDEARRRAGLPREVAA